MLPSGARDISPKWWRVLSNLFFLRYNYRHYNVGSLTSWTQDDSLIAHSIDNFITLARVLQDQEEGQSDHLQALFDPFL
jgi:hypothetical protein